MYENGSLDVRKNRLGHSTLVSMDQNGSPMTTLLRPNSSRDGSPASLFRRQEKTAPPSTPAPTTTGRDLFDEIPDQMPIMPVLILIVGYLTLGNLS